MTLIDTIKKDIIEAMKQKNQPTLEILRYLHSQIKDFEINQARKAATDSEVIRLIQNQIKKLEESNVLFKKANRHDLIAKNNQEIDILKQYLPQEISDAELEKEIELVIKANSQINQPGPLIGIAVKGLGAKASNSRIAAWVMKKLKK